MNIDKNNLKDMKIVNINKYYYVYIKDKLRFILNNKQFNEFLDKLKTL